MLTNSRCKSLLDDAVRQLHCIPRLDEFRELAHHLKRKTLVLSSLFDRNKGIVVEITKKSHRAGRRSMLRIVR